MGMGGRGGGREAGEGGGGDGVKEGWAGGLESHNN